MAPERFVLKDFMLGDGPEFILCDICRFNRNGTCLKKGSAADDNPTELYFNICKCFRSPVEPISPYEFAELMKKAKKMVIDDPEPYTCVETRRYTMEYIMCIMLEMLGYGEGAQVFLDESFELPFYSSNDDVQKVKDKIANETCSL